MSIHRGCSILVLALASTTIPSLAASQTVLTPGSRVRVLDAATRRPQVTGNLVHMAGDTVVIRTADADAPFVITAERHLEVRAGIHSRSGTGMVFGLTFGALAGAVVGAASYEPAEPVQCPPDAWLCLQPMDFGPEVAALGGAVVGGFLGMVVGGLVGSTVKREEWLPVGIRTARFSAVAPAGSQPWVLGVSVAF